MPLFANFSEARVLKSFNRQPEVLLLLIYGSETSQMQRDENYEHNA